MVQLRLANSFRAIGCARPRKLATRMLQGQCEWGRPAGQPQHELELAGQTGPSAHSPLLTLDANTESIFDSLADPHLGQVVPSHFVERTRSSLSCPHFSQ
jgi:hypothetical protein